MRWPRRRDVPVATATAPVPAPESRPVRLPRGPEHPRRANQSGVRRAAYRRVRGGARTPVPSNVEAPVPSTPRHQRARRRRHPSANRRRAATMSAWSRSRRSRAGQPMASNRDRRHRSSAGCDDAAVSARESQRRAADLLRQGEAEAASRAFDALVMSNPLYEPRSSDLNPEALAAFRTSQRLILPVKAQRNYDLAMAALAAGDADRALASPPKLRRSSTAVWRTRRRNCGSNSMPSSRRRTRPSRRPTRSSTPRPTRDVIPPRQLTPADARHRTNRRSAESRRLAGHDHRPRRHASSTSSCNTPLNRHHERMIVSPAKAWKYRPATKRKPVRYRIMRQGQSAGVGDGFLERVSGSRLW